MADGEYRQMHRVNYSPPKRGINKGVIMEYLIVKKQGDGTKLYLDMEGEFGVKSLAYPMPRWIARVVLEEARC